MKKLLLAILLLFPLTAKAEDWKLIFSDNYSGQKFYVDLDTKKVNEDKSILIKQKIVSPFPIPVEKESKVSTISFSTAKYTCNGKITIITNGFKFTDGTTKEYPINRTTELLIGSPGRSAEAFLCN